MKRTRRRGGGEGGWEKPIIESLRYILEWRNHNEKQYACMKRKEPGTKVPPIQLTRDER